MSDHEVRQRLAAILAADAAGYSRLMAIDEHATVAALDAARDVFRRRVDACRGRVIDTAGDSVLAVFDSAAGAVAAALAIQEEMNADTAPRSAGQQLRFRIGIHLGDIIEKADGTVYGNGVNIAARLQAIAEPGSVAISESVRSAVKGKVAATIDDMGVRRMKNIAEPMRIFSVRPDASSAPGGAVQARPSMPRLRRTGSRVVVAAVLVALAAVTGWTAIADSAHGLRSWLAQALGGEPGRRNDERPVIAVLPFRNQSGDATRDYFSDGIAEDITSALGRFPELVVISQNSARAYKGVTPGAQQLRNELGARYLVQGSLRAAEGRFRATVELSDADKGVLLWSERYDEEGAELFAIQDRIVHSIVRSLQVRLTRLEQERAATKPAGSLEAYDLILRARALIERADRNANREARALLAKAMAIAPDYAEAMTALGEAEVQRALFGWVEGVEDAMKRGEDLARRALASADVRAHARAHVLLARINSNLGNSAEALQSADRALALNPGDAGALLQRGASLLFLGRIDEAIRVLEEVRRLDPVMSAGHGTNLVTAYYVAGRHAEALALADLMLVRFPRDVGTHAIRAAALARLNRPEEALRSVEEVRRLSPQFRVEYFGVRFTTAEHTKLVQEGLRLAGL